MVEETNPIVAALREVLGPLVQQTAKLPAPLAYGSAIVLAILVTALLGVVIPNNLVWLLAVVILASLVAFVFTDWDARRRQQQEGVAGLESSVEDEHTPYPPPLADVRFERKIEDQLGQLNELHAKNNQEPGLAELLSALRALFNRKTFDEPFPECKDENWQDRLCAVVQIEYILNKYWGFAKAAASYAEDEQKLLAYEGMQKELRRYSQDMTGLFHPPPQVADLEEQFLAGNLEGMRTELRERGIHPKSRIPKTVLEACEMHRKNILRRVQGWPVFPTRESQDEPLVAVSETDEDISVAEVPSTDLVKLHGVLESRFNLEELRTLCFELGVDYDSLPGEGKSAKARELITHLERRNELDRLVALVRRERGNVV